MQNKNTSWNNLLLIQEAKRTVIYLQAMDAISSSKNNMYKNGIKPMKKIKRFLMAIFLALLIFILTPITGLKQYFNGSEVD